jgi:hypothetical protein
MRPYLITAKLMRPSNMKRFPTPDLLESTECVKFRCNPSSGSEVKQRHSKATQSQTAHKTFHGHHSYKGVEPKHKHFGSCNSP